MLHEVVAKLFPVGTITPGEECTLPLCIRMISIQQILGEFASIDVCLVPVRELHVRMPFSNSHVSCKL